MGLYRAGADPCPSDRFDDLAVPSARLLPASRVRARASATIEVLCGVRVTGDLIGGIQECVRWCNGAAGWWRWTVVGRHWTCIGHALDMRWTCVGRRLDVQRTSTDHIGRKMARMKPYQTSVPHVGCVTKYGGFGSTADS